ncbi:MAG: DUF2059 domain-containing protein, partial [Silanimonas sp.]
GRSMLAKMPALMQESMVLGQTWAAGKAEIVIERIRAREAAKRDATVKDDAVMVDISPPARGKE